MTLFTLSIKIYIKMGSGLSKNEFSRDGDWVMVASSLEKLNEKRFVGMSDEQMQEVAAIMSIRLDKMEGVTDYWMADYWVADTAESRLSSLCWHDDLRQFSYTGVSKYRTRCPCSEHKRPKSREFWRPAYGEPFLTNYLVINLPGLEDYKHWKRGESNGAVFRRIREEQQKIREKPVKMGSKRVPSGFVLLKHNSHPRIPIEERSEYLDYLELESDSDDDCVTCHSPDTEEEDNAAIRTACEPMCVRR